MRDKATTLRLSGAVLSALTLACAHRVPLHSDFSWKEGGLPVPDTPWRKLSGSFGAMIIIADDAEALLRDWNVPGQGVWFDEADSVRPGDEAMAMIVFTGCAENWRGNCDLTVDYALEGFGGRVIAGFPGADLWIDKPAPPFGGLQLSVVGIRLSAETGEPGPLTVRARITDRVARTQMLLERSIPIDASR